MIAAQTFPLELANKIGIGLDQYQFVLTTSFNPVATSKPGIYICGAFEASKDIPFSVIESSAAAGMPVAASMKPAGP